MHKWTSEQASVEQMFHLMHLETKNTRAVKKSDITKERHKYCIKRATSS